MKDKDTILLEQIYLEMSDDIHQDYLDKTGFWGKEGAGCIFFSRHTKRFLIAHRSDFVQEPNTWGTFGGAIDPDENIEDALGREINEEVGYYGPYKLKHIYTFQSGDFRYHNFVAVVDDEFEPDLNWENQGYEWVEFGNWPEPLHFGFQDLLHNAGNKLKLMV